MNKRTEEEILAEVARIWIGKKYYDSNAMPDKVKVSFDGDVVHLTIGSMYEPPGLNLKELIALSEFFGTKRIRDQRYSYGGCETCDYGSDYGFTLIIGEPETA